MLLALDTTTEILHLALLQHGREGERVFARRVPAGVGRGHSERLLPTLNELMAEAGAGSADLSGVAACLGPGGFTSLRIGVATTEGFGLTGLPTWGFSAFALRAEALRQARGQAGAQGPFWILLDGQRGEAFHQRWEDGPTEPAAKHPLADLPARLGTEAWWAPEAFAPKVEALLSESLSGGRITLADEGEATLAGLVALARRVSQGPPEAPLVPFYLRETDAEVNFPQAAAHLPEALRKGLPR
ncbi:tRNA (adenosine(37)-N6)-threonylcarbamoyltransferase complex dimerization subunit type 1 TsaB [Geothrix sp. PMB-07]|uniref:tRNA (adenosine(37)-N6)-threonylcarbamoyltransferase complex dimerization subunit type 1 TsaB n=1 Tax=Geothrix sp. PMB-07 TaxID=3068640 RepID=UPI002740E77B|nr:tRNA (adenosine(37)-N6)-threonylcarbamoyltransferase complex dimerization subunit type 1 TsaB [Geothrix sp. PMB-07]WLT30787.1 tRNA (adenosine(37)-N6)-threonylcarbamoyltransferase complex dimerization subunit type 1 TsaB [Geothrix sp. PMB-07]